MYSDDEQFADKICKIVDPKDVYTGAQIIKLVEEKFTSTNGDYTQCAHEWVLIEGNPVVHNTDICVKCHSVRAHSA